MSDDSNSQLRRLLLGYGTEEMSTRRQIEEDSRNRFRPQSPKQDCVVPTTITATAAPDSPGVSSNAGDVLNSPLPSRLSAGSLSNLDLFADESNAAWLSIPNSWQAEDFEFGIAMLTQGHEQFDFGDMGVDEFADQLLNSVRENEDNWRDAASPGQQSLDPQVQHSPNVQSSSPQQTQQPNINYDYISKPLNLNQSQRGACEARQYQSRSAENLESSQQVHSSMLMVDTAFSTSHLSSQYNRGRSLPSSLPTNLSRDYNVTERDTLQHSTTPDEYGSDQVGPQGGPMFKVNKQGYNPQRSQLSELPGGLDPYRSDLVNPPTDHSDFCDGDRFEQYDWSIATNPDGYQPLQQQLQEQERRHQLQQLQLQQQQHLQQQFLSHSPTKGYHMSQTEASLVSPNAQQSEYQLGVHTGSQYPHMTNEHSPYPATANHNSSYQNVVDQHSPYSNAPSQQTSTNQHSPFHHTYQDPANQESPCLSPASQYTPYQNPNAHNIILSNETELTDDSFSQSPSHDVTEANWPNDGTQLASLLAKPEPEYSSTNQWQQTQLLIGSSNPSDNDLPRNQEFSYHSNMQFNSQHDSQIPQFSQPTNHEVSMEEGSKVEVTSRRTNTEQVLKECGLFEAAVLTGRLVNRDKQIESDLADFKSQLAELMSSLNNM